MRDVTVHWQLLTRSIYSQQKDAPGHHSLQSPLDLVSKSDFTECRFNSDHGITLELIAPPPRQPDRPAFVAKLGAERARELGEAVEGVKWRQVVPGEVRNLQPPGKPIYGRYGARLSNIVSLRRLT